MKISLSEKKLRLFALSLQSNVFPAARNSYSIAASAVGHVTCKAKQKKIGEEYPSNEDVILILKIKYSTYHNVLIRYDKGQVIY